MALRALVLGGHAPVGAWVALTLACSCGSAGTARAPASRQGGAETETGTGDDWIEGHRLANNAVPFWVWYVPRDEIRRVVDGGGDR